MADNEAWRQIRALPRTLNAELPTADVPEVAGVFVWFRQEEPIQLGMTRNLRQRLIGNGTPSPLAGVIGKQLTKLRAAVIPAARLQASNAWLDECSVAWSPCAGKAEAKQLRDDLVKDWKPARPS